MFSKVPRLSYSAVDEEAWDKLWVFYFAKEPQQLAHQDTLKRAVLPEKRDDFIEDVSLFIHCEPDAIEDKNVLEIGCGCGWLAKHIAHFTRHYVGIDWSGLALLVAKRTCPNSCTWLHATDSNRIREFGGSIDTVMFRNFIIHQDFDHCANILRFSRSMLAKDGKIYADFWLDAGEIERPNVFPARTPPTMRRSNSSFRYTEEEIGEVASTAGLRVGDMYQRPDKLRNFVVFTR